MNEYDVDEILVVAGWVDDCFDNVFEDHPDWVDTPPDGVKDLIDTLKAIRERLKQAAGGSQLW